jgi:hypothetical protein
MSSVTLEDKKDLATFTELPERTNKNTRIKEKKQKKYLYKKEVLLKLKH